MKLPESFNRKTDPKLGEAVVLVPVCATFVGVMTIVLGTVGFVLALLTLFVAERYTRPTEAEMETP